MTTSRMPQDPELIRAIVRLSEQPWFVNSEFALLEDVPKERILQFIVKNCPTSSKHSFVDMLCSVRAWGKSTSERRRELLRSISQPA